MTNFKIISNRLLSLYITYLIYFFIQPEIVVDEPAEDKEDSDKEEESPLREAAEDLAAVAVLKEVIDQEEEEEAVEEAVEELKEEIQERIEEELEDKVKKI